MMETQTAETSPARGLEGIVVAETSICFIDGLKGILLYRGIPIGELAEKSNFEEVCRLLWDGELPKAGALEELRKNLIRERPLSKNLLNLIKGLPPEAIPMDVLRTAVSMLALEDPEVKDNSREANLRKAIRLTAKIPTILSAFHRSRNKKKMIALNSKLNHAANFLYMLFGKVPTPMQSQILDAVLVLHADHDFNASTFSARVTASTLTDIHAAVTSAIGTLKGPLHGGANQDVMEMLKKIKTPENARAYVEKALSEKKKIPGFGHRVYKAYDPRARILKKICQKLSREDGDFKWFEVSSAVEEAMSPVTSKGVWPNVDFYVASVYSHLEIPMDFYPALFATARIAGWSAHIIEQFQNNKIIRPASSYIGLKDQPYIPLAQR